MTVFFEKMAEGFCAAGWIFGILFGLGAFLIVIGAVGYVMKQVFGDDKNEQEDDEP